MLSIQTNVAALYGQQNLSVNSAFQQTTISRLTSGYRINSSADDAAGLAVANALRGQRNELTQGVRNANDGVSQLQIIDGGLNNVSQILDRLRTLATQSASGTFTGDRSVLNQEFTKDLSELDRQAGNIGLNTGGNYLQSLSVYIGGGIGTNNGNIIGSTSETIDLSSSTADSTGLSVNGSTVDTAANAQSALSAIETRRRIARQDPGRGRRGHQPARLRHHPRPVSDHQLRCRRIAHPRCRRRFRSRKPEQVAGPDAVLDGRPCTSQPDPTVGVEAPPINFSALSK